jgi:putative transposase
MMQGIGRLYVAEFNARQRRTGTLWEGHYKSCLVGGERYVLPAIATSS